MTESHDFAARIDGKIGEFEALSPSAKAWLASTGKGEGPTGTLVYREGVSASVFLEALQRKGFTCSLPERWKWQPGVSGASKGQSERPHHNGFQNTLVAGLFCAPLAGIVYLTNWLFGDAIAFAIGVLGFGLIAWAVISASMSEKEASQNRDGLQSLDFNPDIFDSVGYGEFISIDKSGRRFAFKVKGSLYLRTYSEIIAVEIEQDGSSVEKTNRGSQLDGALAGALLGGPAGMLMGGLSGSKRIEQKVHALTLNVFTRDLHAPTIKVPFLCNPAGAALDSGEYQKARKLAQDWYGRIRAVM